MKNFKINSLCSKPSEPMPRCQDRCRHCRQKQLEYTKMQSVLRSEALEVRVGKYKRLVIFSRYIGRNRASLKRYFSSPEKQVLHLKYLSPIFFLHLTLVHGLILYTQITYFSRVRRSRRSAGGGCQTCKQRCFMSSQNSAGDFAGGM